MHTHRLLSVQPKHTVRTVPPCRPRIGECKSTALLHYSKPHRAVLQAAISGSQRHRVPQVLSRWAQREVPERAAGCLQPRQLASVQQPACVQHRRAGLLPPHRPVHWPCTRSVCETPEHQKLFQRSPVVLNALQMACTCASKLSCCLQGRRSTLSLTLCGMHTHVHKRAHCWADHLLHPPARWLTCIVGAGQDLEPDVGGQRQPGHRVQVGRGFAV